MSSDSFLKNPLPLFDIRGKTAIATGAFGALAAKVLAGAGANLVIAAGKADELKNVVAECEGTPLENADLVGTDLTLAIHGTVLRAPDR